MNKLTTFCVHLGLKILIRILARKKMMASPLSLKSGRALTQIVKELAMRNLFVGVILGIVISTQGFSGLIRLLDSGVDAVKQTSKDIVK